MNPALPHRNAPAFEVVLWRWNTLGLNIYTCNNIRCNKRQWLSDTRLISWHLPVRTKPMEQFLRWRYSVWDAIVHLNFEDTGCSTAWAVLLPIVDIVEGWVSWSEELTKCGDLLSSRYCNNSCLQFWWAFSTSGNSWRIFWVIFFNINFFGDILVLMPLITALMCYSTYCL